MAKSASNKKKIPVTSKLDSSLRNKIVISYIWSIALCGAETYTSWNVDQKYLESFEMWSWREMEKISLTDRVGNEVLQRVKEERNTVLTTKERKTI
jgi:hypothetical protein